MRALLFIACMIAYHLAQAQINVVDKRNGGDSTAKPVNTSQVDHRNIIDMSTTYIQPTFENMPVYRIQLRITTGQGNGAATDGRVYVKLAEDEGYWKKTFYLFKEGGNFREGITQTYDIIDASIKFVKDIKKIELGVSGNDGVCFTRVELLLNNCSSPVYSSSGIVGIGNTQTKDRGICIDNNSEEKKLYTISHAQLRNNGDWNFNEGRKNMWRPHKIINTDWIKSILECSLGNQMIDKWELNWGDFLKTMPGSLKIKFRLTIVQYLARDLHADVSFTLKAFCEDNVLNLYADNMSFSATGIDCLDAEVIRRQIHNSLGFLSYEDRKIRQGSSNKIYTLFYNYRPFFIQNSTRPCGCAIAEFAENGDLILK
ncbi:MAG: hypothetical protein RIR12_2615 [Bacteroidota bacterium]